MAWTCSAATNEGLVAAMKHASIVKTAAVQQAMLRIDRAWFVPAALRNQAYNDNPLPIGYNATISAPHMHAIMLELLLPYLNVSAPHVLDIGSGSGYLTAALGDLCGSDGVVLGVEHVPQLLEASESAVRQYLPEWLSSGRLRFVRGDGRSIGEILPDPTMRFNVIHVGAAAEPNVASILAPFLKPGGCIVIPVQRTNGDRESQVLMTYTKDDAGNITAEDCGGVIFVPLTSLDKQLRR